MKARLSTIILSALLCACASTPNYDAQGTFEATEITVASETAGKIVSLDVEEGDSVVAGRPVGLVDTLQLHLQRLELMRQRAAVLASRPDLSAQAASLRQQIAGAVTDRDRTERLLAQGAATQKQLDDLNTRLSSLQGQLQALGSQVATATASLDEKAAALDTQIAAVADKIARSAVASPISGIVLTKTAEAGEVAAYGTPLFRVADLGDMYLRAYFTSDQLADLSVGRKVKVVADYGGGTQREYEGTVSYISPSSEFTPKTIQTKDSRANLVYAVKIAVANDGLLKIGLSGNVIL